MTCVLYHCCVVFFLCVRWLTCFGSSMTLLRRYDVLLVLLVLLVSLRQGGFVGVLPALSMGVKKAPGLEGMADVPLAVLAPSLGVAFNAIKALLPV